MDALKSRTRLTYRLLSAFIAFTFSFTSVVPPSYAQSIAGLNLPVPGAMVGPSAAFVPVLLKGMTIHPDNPLQFDFIIDSGNTNFTQDQIKDESQRLVKYFLASMTIPKDDLWVNLSPYEKDRIIPDELGKTELGRDMLAQDYILKQLTASLMYPEKELGKEFWDKVYKKIREEYGTIRPPLAGETSPNSQGEFGWAEIPVDTFNKVWILPETATVYEHGQTVYIVDAKLKVMLDADYEASRHEQNVGAPLVGARDKAGTSPAPTGNNISTSIIREIILPEIEREINEGQNFAPLRQIYHSLILAKWYKETIKNSLLSQVYVDKKLINGIRLEDGQLKGEDGSIIDSQSSIVDQIYDQYMEAYKKGVFNYIKEDYDRLSRETIPRKYFSGGIDRLMNFKTITLNKTSNPARVASAKVGQHFTVATITNPQKDVASSPIFDIPGTLAWHRKRLKHENPDIRLKAVHGIAKTMKSTDIELLKGMFLNDPDARIRKAAVEVLIENEIDVNFRDEIGGTALIVALFKGDLDIAELLIKNGADVNAKDDNGWTALMSAFYPGRLDIVKLLIRKGADVNAKVNDGWTALMSASQGRHLEGVKLLVEEGADVNAENNEGKTASEYAVPRIKDYLRSRGAKEGKSSSPIIEFDQFHEDDVNWLWGKLSNKKAIEDQDLKRAKIIWDENGNLRPQDGVSLVMWLDPNSEVYRNIARAEEQIIEELNRNGLGNKVKFNPMDRLHMTFASLDVDRQKSGRPPLTSDEKTKLQQKTEPIFQNAQSMTFGVRGINVTPAFSLAVKVAPLRGQADSLLAVKRELSQNINSMVADRRNAFLS